MAGGEDRAMRYRYGAWFRASTPMVRDKKELVVERSNSSTASAKGYWWEGKKNLESLREVSVGERSSKGNHGFLGDEFREVEEEMEVYGVNSIAKLQAIKDSEYDVRFGEIRRVEQSNCFSEGSRVNVLINPSLHNDGDNSIEEVIAVNAAMESVQVIGTAIKSVGKQVVEVDRRNSNATLMRRKESSGMVVAKRVERTSVVENEKHLMVTREERKSCLRVNSKGGGISSSKNEPKSGTKRKILDDMEIEDGEGKRMKSDMETLSPELLVKSAMQTR
ncbi:hypothetical protein PanWU01x14_076590 [Parasponia andersonii]|uniref:Uncharacterized protein n=1 Tax=Parasponia andersonii TaxID=3476 RepID=A0A2P5DCC9_PARAD|nr:hypothetical protein PanWU01x14_076590 [Parasponia andersonii]